LVQYYDQISSGYSELHREEQLKKIEIIKKHLHINPNDLLLDIGCGPYYGDFPCKAIGVDSSHELLKYAKIPVIQANAENLPFKDNTFDIVVSITAIQNFTDIEKALLEAKRVGKNRFAFTYLKKSEKRELIESLISKHFELERIEEDKDIIFFTKYK